MRFSLHLLFSILFAMMLATPGRAVEITDAWARATVPGARVGAAYLKLTSPVKARLVSASSPACKRVEIHSSSMDDGTMRMRQLKYLDLPAGQTVELKPMATHLMLMDLKVPLKPGDRVDIELVVQEGSKRKSFAVSAEVRSLTE